MPIANNTRLIVGIIAVASLFFVGLVWLVVRTPADPSSRNAGQPESVSFNDETSPALGTAGAKTIVHMYSDFQCPACKLAEPPLKEVIDTYKDRVRFVWKDFPLGQIHSNARSAANAARCAADQNKFWEYHDQLYAKQSDWDKLNNPASVFIQIAQTIGLEQNVFATCLQAKTHDDKIASDMTEGLRNNVDRTPTFFINNRRYFTMSAVEWRQALDKLITP